MPASVHMCILAGKVMKRTYESCIDLITKFIEEGSWGLLWVWQIRYYDG